MGALEATRGVGSLKIPIQKYRLTHAVSYNKSSAFEQIDEIDSFEESSDCNHDYDNKSAPENHAVYHKGLSRNLQDLDRKDRFYTINKKSPV